MGVWAKSDEKDGLSTAQTALEKQIGKDNANCLLSTYDTAIVRLRASRQYSTGNGVFDIERLIEGLGTPQQRAHDIFRFTGMDPTVAMYRQGLDVDGVPRSEAASPKSKRLQSLCHDGQLSERGVARASE